MTGLGDWIIGKDESPDTGNAAPIPGYRPARGIRLPSSPPDVAGAGALSGYITAPDPQQEDAKFGASMDLAHATNPDEAAKVLKLRLQTGLPADMIQRDIPYFEREVARTGFDAKAFRASSPRVAEWLQNPENAAVARDDTDNLGQLERFFMGQSNPAMAGVAFTPVGEAWQAGSDQITLSEIRNLQREGKASPAQIAQADNLSKAMEEAQRVPRGRVGQAIESVGEMLPQLVRGAGFGARAGLVGGGAVGAIAGLGVFDPLTVPAGAAIGGAVGSTFGMGDFFGKLTAGLQYDRLLKVRTLDGRPLDPKVIGPASDLAYAIGFALGAVPLEKAMSLLPGVKGVFAEAAGDAVARALTKPTLAAAMGTYAKHAASTAALGTLAMTAQEAALMATQKVAEEIDGGQFQPQTTKEVFDHLAETAISVLGTMAIIGAVAPFPGLLHDAGRARAASRNQQVFEALGESAKASKLRERLPEKYQEAVQSIVKDGPVENIFAPAQEFVTYMQSQGLDPEAVAAHVGVTPQEYAEARATGGDLVIPTEKYASELAPNHPGLAQDLRFHQGDMTAREAKAFMAEAGKRFEEMVKKYGEGDQPAESSPDFLSQYTEQTAQQLEATGVEPEMAAKQADFFARFYKVTAGRLNTTPEALAQRFQLSVGPEDASGGTVLGQGERGQIKISAPGEQGQRTFRISLLEGANATTVFHELGHFYLTALDDLGAEGRAAGLVADRQAIRDWLGAKEGEALTTAHQEQFARGFETYLMEGKAPSPDLLTVFARIKQWFLSVYRNLKNLGVELTPEVRGVMDRLLATDDEINAARQIQGFEPLFDKADESLMTEQEFKAYQKSAVLAEEKQKQGLLDRVNEEEKRVKEAWWIAETERTRAEVTTALHADPAYQVLHYLKEGRLLGQEPPTDPQPDALNAARKALGLDPVEVWTSADDEPPAAVPVPVKLSKAILTDRYGKDHLDQFKVNGQYLYSAKGGIDPDLLAAQFGFDSGDQMLLDLKAKEGHPLDTEIEAQTAAQMEAKHPGLLRDSAELARAAQEAVHGGSQLNVLLTELRLLGRQTGNRVAPDMVATRHWARNKIGRTPLRDLSVFKYQQAEAKAGKLALEAARKGDFAESDRTKRQQILNHLLWQEALKAQTATEKAVDYIRPFGADKKRAVLGKAGGTYLEQMDALLERFSFRPRSLKAIDRTQALADWIKSEEDGGWQVVIPQDLRNETFRTNYKNLTVDQILGLRDSVKNIEHLALYKNKLLAAKAERDFQTVKDGVVSAILAHRPATVTPPRFTPLSGKEKVAKFGRWADAAMVKPEFLFDELDGYEKLGPVHEALYGPIGRADDAGFRRLKQLNADLEPILGQYTREERQDWHTKRVVVPEVENTFSKASLIAVAANWGNEGNRKALLDGYGWTETQTRAIMRHLDPKDFRMVQQLWDLMETFRPDMAALQKDLTGLEPKWVEASPFTVEASDGSTVEMRGGYYPLKYDGEASYRVFQHDEIQSTKQLFASNHTKPQTEQGMYETRVGSGGQPVKLDLGVFTTHFSDLIHDLTHRRAIMDVDRLIQDPEIRAAIEGTAGKDAYRTLRPWLKHVAGDVADPSGVIGSVIAKANRGATMVHIGLKITTALVQPLGFLNTMELIGPAYTWRGIQDFFGSPAHIKEQLAFMFANSATMEGRPTQLSREIRDYIRDKGPGYILTLREKAAFAFVTSVDMAVTGMSWKGIYLHGMEQVFKGDHDKSVAYADKYTRMSQSSGLAKDLAAIQQGTKAEKMFTLFFTYASNDYNLMRRSVKQFKGGSISLPEFVGSIALLWLAPAIMQDLLAARTPKKDEDWGTWTAKNFATYPFQAIVGLRDIVNGLQYRDYQVSPVVGAGASLVQLGKAVPDLLHGDVTRGTTHAALNALGFWGELPTDQMWTTGSSLFDWMTDRNLPKGPVDAATNLLLRRTQ